MCCVNNQAQGEVLSLCAALVRQVVATLVPLDGV